MNYKAFQNSSAHAGSVGENGGALTPAANDRAFRALVSGHVQGVGFRWTCACEAWRLGIYGWARNLSNGDVEVYAEGGAGKLEALFQWLRRGPARSQVDSVDHENLVPTGKYHSFEIR